MDSRVYAIDGHLLTLYHPSGEVHSTVALHAITSVSAPRAYHRDHEPATGIEIHVPAGKICALFSTEPQAQKAQIDIIDNWAKALKKVYP